MVSTVIHYLVSIPVGKDVFKVNNGDTRILSVECVIMSLLLTLNMCLSPA